MTAWVEVLVWLVPVALLVLGARWYAQHHAQVQAERMVADFQRQFPGRCPVCSFHRFGRLHGTTDQLDPAPHTCPEHGELVGSYRTTRLLVEQRAEAKRNR